MNTPDYSPQACRAGIEVHMWRMLIAMLVLLLVAAAYKVREHAAVQVPEPAPVVLANVSAWYWADETE